MSDILEAISTIIIYSGADEYEVYRAAGIRQSTLDSWAKGTQYPTLRIIVRIAIAAQVCSGYRYRHRIISNTNQMVQELGSKLRKNKKKWPRIHYHTNDLRGRPRKEEALVH